MTPSNVALAERPLANASLSHPVLATSAEAVAAAAALLPRIRARAALAEDDRGIPRDTIEEITAAGLLDIARPRAFGGTELGLAAMVQVTTELASACGSTGWVYGVLAGHNWMVGLFSEQTQTEVFADPAARIASVFRLTAQVTLAPGGYTLSGGEGRFCSGVDHSSWVIVGSAIPKADGTREPGFFLVPITDVTVIDDWFTAGMRGTGSRSIRIASAFIPAHRVIRIADIQAGTTPGALVNRNAGFKAPFGVAQPFSLIGAPLGMAKAALRSVCDSMAKKLANQGSEAVAEQSATFARIAEAAADIDAATTLVLRDCATIDSSTDPSALARVDRLRIQGNLAYAAQKCRYAVTSLFEAAGGSGIYNGSALQRSWRDVNCAAAHTAFALDGAATSYGRALLDLPPGKLERG